MCSKYVFFFPSKGKPTKFLGENCGCFTWHPNFFWGERSPHMCDIKCERTKYEIFQMIFFLFFSFGIVLKPQFPTFSPRHPKNRYFCMYFEGTKDVGRKTIFSTEKNQHRTKKMCPKHNRLNHLPMIGCVCVFPPMI